MLKQLRKNPKLLPQGTEEILRYETPVQTVARVAIEDVELDGYTIRKGERVVVSLGAANRDPLQFNQAAQFDIKRPIARNLAFGSGIHYCLGSNLAKMVCQIAFSAISQEFCEIKLANDPPKWRNNFIIRSLERLIVVLHK
ncbi:hypothetical protein AB835_13390 [Candidatus Endobugula sertula]|uniref:Cytochrome n=1 Tax=Candidatus Endobugula sertula TaxID=62101 RepID=A0A1D2QLX9_9GAMM|nr:hypothetical protein AB835_13390 [Candidatus Endobugula sertula]